MVRSGRSELYAGSDGLVQQRYTPRVIGNILPSGRGEETLLLISPPNTRTTRLRDHPNLEEAENGKPLGEICLELGVSRFHRPDRSSPDCSQLGTRMANYQFPETLSSDRKRAPSDCLIAPPYPLALKPSHPPTDKIRTVVLRKRGKRPQKPTEPSDPYVSPLH